MLAVRAPQSKPTITVRGDIDEALQPPQVSMEIQTALQPIMAKLPAGYRVEMAGASEKSAKANAALAAVMALVPLTQSVVWAPWPTPSSAAPPSAPS